MLNLPKVTCYQAASGSESSEASNCIPFEIFLCIYMYIYIHFRTLCKQTLQLHKLGWYSCTSLMAAPCTEWYIALQVHSTLFSGFLRSVAFLHAQSSQSQMLDNTPLVHEITIYRQSATTIVSKKAGQETKQRQDNR